MSPIQCTGDAIFCLLYNTIPNLYISSLIYPTTLEAIPNKIYRIEGTTKADVRGMELSKMKDGDKIYFSVETDVGTLTLSKLSNNFWLPSDTYSCPRDKVVCMIMVNGVMRLLE